MGRQAFKAAGEAAKWIDEKVNQSLYHTAKGIYAMANNDSEKANEELDKAVDSLHRTMII